MAIADQINGGAASGLDQPGALQDGREPGQVRADFFDIAQTGDAGHPNNNQGDPSVPGYPATNGWDPVTGLGTPNAAKLIPDLVDAAHS